MNLRKSWLNFLRWLDSQGGTAVYVRGQAPIAVRLERGGYITRDGYRATIADKGRAAIAKAEAE